MARGGVRALEHTPSFCVSQACPQAAPSSGVPWYERLGIAENDLQSPAVHNTLLIYMAQFCFNTPDAPPEAKSPETCAHAHDRWRDVGGP
jgi:hypothetical protein